jgi:hypothetical protein
VKSLASLASTANGSKPLGMSIICSPYYAQRSSNAFALTAQSFGSHFGKFLDLQNNRADIKRLA